MISSKTTVAANAVGGKTARACDSCVKKRARWYCAADDAFLCQACDSSVHSANSLARRHERVRLNSASHKLRPNGVAFAPSWHKGFTRKARTPRNGKPTSTTTSRPKSSDESSSLSALIPNPFFSLVPEADETTSFDEDEQLLFRVPIFDPFVVSDNNKSNDSENKLNGFLPADMDDLAEFAADVESLLGKNLENECFDIEELGFNIDRKDQNGGVAADDQGCLDSGKVKVEDEEQLQFDVNEIDLMRQPFELNFDEYDEAAVTTTATATPVEMIAVKNEHGECLDESKPTKKKRKVSLSLNFDSVIAAWGTEKTPWMTGDRPEFDPDDTWPNCMATCGVNYRHSCIDPGVIVSVQAAAARATGGREARVSRYREKRRTRLFSKKIRYEVRKLNAEKRPRMKGRFVKRTTPFATPTIPILNIN